MSEWTTRAQLALTRKKGRRILAVSIEVASLVVVALESTTSSSRRLGVSFTHVLDNHAHKLLGTWPTLSAAIAAAEAFVEDWDGGTPLELCQCGLAEGARTRRKPRRAALPTVAASPVGRRRSGRGAAPRTVSKA